MQEKNLRKVHRNVGSIIAVFIIIQAFSGTLLSFQLLWGGTPFGLFVDGFLDLVHFNLGPAGYIYRILLGLSIIWMAVTGGWISLKIRARSLSK